MSFAEPLWFLLLIAIPLVIVLQIFIWKRRGKAWKQLIAQRLRKRLSHPRSATKYFVGLALAMLGLLLLVISLAMPEAGDEWIETRNEGRNLLLCMDISQSMLTEDVGSGSRLDAAKAAALEIADRFPNDRIGLLIFSGETQITVPLTIDHTFLTQTISQLNPLDLPLGGSDLSQALKDAVEVFVETKQRNNVMIVFSDGEDHSSGIESAARRAKGQGVFIYSLGFGSEKGDFIRDPRMRDGFFVDRRNNRVVSQLKEESLRTIAAETGGVYSKGAGGDFLQTLNAAVGRMDVFQQEGNHQRIAKPVYQWFLLPGLLFLMSSIIVSRLPSAPIAACLAIMVFFSCVDQAPAGELREIYEGKAANERGDHEAAHEHFHEAAESATGERGAQLHLASGASASKAKLWGSAVSSYSQALLANNTEIKQDAHYGLANSLFYLGSSREDQAERQKAWVGAVKHYEESLKIEPTKEAEENLSFVKSLLKKDQSEEQEDKEDKEESEEKDDKEESSDEEESKKDDQEDSEKGKDDPTDQEDKTKEEQSDDPKEGGEPKPEDGDPKDGEDDPKKEEGKEGQPDESEKKDGEGESDPQESEKSESDQEKGEEDEMANLQQEEKPPKEETAEERARRILNQQADFGKRPPSSQRRVLRRPKKDW